MRSDKRAAYLLYRAYIDGVEEEDLLEIAQDLFRMNKKETKEHVLWAKAIDKLDREGD